MVTLPFLRAVTLPFESTLAILELLDFHLTFLFDALDGETVALSVYVCVVYMVTLVLLSLTLVTFFFFAADEVNAIENVPTSIRTDIITAIIFFSVFMVILLFG